jgi:hypothetical protein
MSGAKDIRLCPISAQDARTFVKRHHYSGKTTSNSQLHLGIFLDGGMVGAMQFGPSLDKRKLIGLVAGTQWNGFIELNRLALVDDTPRNTESRALAVAMRIIRREYPHIGWVVSFADATQCGDGTIYRAAGFVLTGIKPNKQILDWNGRLIAKKTLDDSNYPRFGGKYFSRYLLETGQAIPLPGFQLRYVYFLDPTARGRLTVPEIPFGKIAEVGASMYKGRPKDSSEPAAIHAAEGGAAPTRTLQSLFPLRDRMARLAGK